jgi:replicative DNA helicase
VSSLTIHTAEQLVLAIAFTWGSAPVKHLISQGLDHYKFTKEHAPTWKAISELVLLEGVEPSLINVLNRGGGDHEYFKSLLVQLTDYGITHAEQADLDVLGKKVYDAGRLRAVEPVLFQYQQEMSDLDGLADKITTVDEYLGGLARQVSEVQDLAHTGYVPINEPVQDTRETLARMERGEVVRLVTGGWKSTLAHGLWPRKSMTVIHGTPGHGKTQLVLQAILGTAIQLYQNQMEGCVALNSLEMDVEDIIIRLACLLSGVDFTLLESGVGPNANYKLLDRALTQVEKLPIWIDDNPNMTTDALALNAGLLNMGTGPIHILATDYGQLMADTADHEEAKVSRVFRRQKRLARTFGFAMLAVSQDTMEKSNPHKMPSVYDLRWSKGIQQDADVIAVVWNPLILLNSNEKFSVPQGMDKDHAWIVIQKYRKGRVGKFPLIWDMSCGRFRDPRLEGTMFGQNSPLFEGVTKEENVWAV